MDRFSSAAMVLLLLGNCQLLAAERPNIILCMADDQGWGDMAYNGHPRLKTPVFDEMARTCLRLDHFYAAAPVCSPTRASVLTGRTPNRGGVFSWGHSLRPQELTLAEALRGAGYATGHFGKWHLGSVLPDNRASPAEHGFDQWISAPNFFEIDPWLSRRGRAEARKGEGSEVVVEDALAFIKQQAADSQPFLAVIWFGSPHAPHVGSQRDLDLYADLPKKQQHFLAEITAMDRAVGRLRSELRKLDAAQNTLLWFCSDNGAIPQGSTGGLRGRKGTVYDGGLRVPCLIEWPAQITAPRRSDVVASTVDIYPTVLELAQARPAKQPVLDGVSLVSLLNDRMQTRPQPLGFWDAKIPGKRTPSDQILAAVAEQQKTGAQVTDQAALGFPPAPLEWKYDAEVFPGHAAWLDGPWKLHRIADARGKNVRWELYNLSEDPTESKDLSSAQHQRLADMQKALHAWLGSVTGSLRGEDYK